MPQIRASIEHQAVNTVLAEIDSDEIPTLLVMNKIDMLDDFVPRIDRNDETCRSGVAVRRQRERVFRCCIRR